MKNKILSVFVVLVLSITSLFAQQTTEFEAQFKLGNQRFEQKDYDGAISAYSECLRLAPTQSSCYGNRGITYREKSNFTQAIADYTEAIKYSPSNAKYYYLRAHVYHQEKKYDLAIADYTQAIKIDSNNVVYYKRRSDAYYAVEKYDLVVADLKAALKIDPENADLKRLLESATKTAGIKQEIDKKTQELVKNKEIVEAGRRIIGDKGLGELNAPAADFFKSGKEQFEKKDTAAIQSFSQCLRLKPDFADCYFFRGKVYDQERQYEKAVADFTQAIKLQPQNVEYYRRRAMTNDYSLDKYDAAIADYNEIIKLDPKFSTWYMSRGYVFVKKKDYQRALDDFTQAINLESSSSSKKVYYGSRADLYGNKLKNYAASIADYTEIIKIDQRDWTNYANRGFVYLKNKNYEKAVADYTEALKLGAAFPASMLEYRARAYCGLGKRALAMADEKKVREAVAKVEFPCQPIR